MKDHQGFFSSLSVRLMALLILVVVAGSVLTLASVTRIAQRQFLSYVQESDHLRARELAASLASYYADRGDFRGVEELLRPAPHPRAGETMMRRMQGMHGSAMPGMMPAMLPERIILLDERSRIVADTRPSELSVRTGSPFPDASVRGEPIADTSPAGTADDQPVGWVLVGSMIDSTFNPLQEQFLGALRRAVLLSALIVGIVAMVLGSLFVAGITRPLRELTRAAGTIADGNLAVTVPSGGGGEVEALADSFRAMRASLEAAESQRDRMFRNIAHELRTPVTLLRGEIEAMLDGIYTIDRDSLRSLQEEIGILDRLASDLRLISSMDGGDFPLQREPVDPADLLERVAVAFRREADAAGLVIRTNISHPLPQVEVDRARIMQVIGNLVVNALRHGKTANEIVLSAAPAARSGVEIAVTDNGHGIPKEHLDRVFERLYRVEEARSRATGSAVGKDNTVEEDDAVGRNGTHGKTGERDGSRMSGGSGLGLSIARRIVEAHGGSINAENPVDGGFRIRVLLPGGNLAPPRDLA